MRIFIDARMIHIGGTLTVATSLLNALLKLYGDDHEFIVLHARGQEKPDCLKAEIIYTRTKNPILWLLGDYFSLDRLIKKYNPDIFHTLKRPLLRQIKGPKKIITLHAAHPYFHPEFQSTAERIYWTPRMKTTAQSADAVVTVSNTERENISKALNIPMEKIHTVYNAADSIFTKDIDDKSIQLVKKKYNLPENYVLFAGNAYRYKNLPNTFKAYDIFATKSDLPHKFVWIGGSGVAEKEIHGVVDAMKNKSQLIKLGIIPRQDVPLIFKAADLFVFPTIYDAFGIPVIESMSCGTPVIISNLGALPEVAGDAAMQVDPYDPEAMANAFIDMLSNPETLAEYKAKGIERAKQFSWEKSADITIQLYQDILAKA